MDILLGGIGKKSEYKSESKQYQSEESKAPLELMSQFLILIADRRMKEALVVCNELLTYEPRNKMLLEYKASINSYIAQGKRSSLQYYFVCNCY